MYATYFDSGYLSRGLTLIASIRAFGDTSPIHVLALDSAAFDYLKNARLEHVHVHSMEDLESFEPRLVAVKPNRTRAEYIFTCTPWLLRYVTDRFSTPHQLVVYLDADLAFFAPPERVVEAMNGASVGIIEHRYHPSRARALAKYGRFNVGWVGFRHDQPGHTLLDWYGEKTLEWCQDAPSDGRYADQGYLDWFPEFPGVRILGSHGFNLAPWNERGQRFDIARRPDGRDVVRVNGDELVFFHFHGLKRSGRRYVTGELAYSTVVPRLVKRMVYRPYVDSLEAAERLLSEAVRAPTRSAARGGSGWKGVVSRMRKQALTTASVLIGNSVPIRDTPETIR